MQIIEEFIKKEAAGGILLICTTLLALILSNTFMSPLYETFLHIPVGIDVGVLRIEGTLYHMVNDLLMAFFFLLIGLEVKREFLEGELSTWQQAALPGFAAAGGMIVPAVFYFLLNQHDATAIKGWAIPTATDIAFALGILSLLGKRVPASLKIFLMALAIMDDLGAITIITLFYTSALYIPAVIVATIAIAALIGLNRFGISRQAAYFVVGTVLWVSVLKSGIHATLAGVIVAFAIPLHVKNRHNETVYPARDIEHGLHFWVTFLILPLFAFVNAGVNITDISLGQMSGSVPMGIILGLFIGKQLGVFVFGWLAIKLNLAVLPKNSSWMQLYGTAILTGVGFTMSLFIASLAFEDESMFQYTDKLAVLVGSFASGIVGYLVLKITAGGHPNR
ncbi:MAG: Na+/H+ antiporter NhaA [Mariprofundaceae bacterium]